MVRLGVGGLWADGVSGWRAVRRRPGFAVAVVVTFGLGMGANTAVFSLVDAVVLRPLPYEDPGDLYSVFEQHTSGRMRLPSYPAVRDWGEQVDGLSDLAFARGAPVTYRTEEHTGFLLGAFVTAGFFDLLGVEAELGRVLTPDDYRGGAEGAVVVSHRAWERWFGSDPEVLGTTLVAEEMAFSVVGVLPPSFAFPDWGADNDLWMPISKLPASGRPALDQRGFSADSRVVARVQGAERARVQQSLDAVAASLAATYPEVSAGWTSTRLIPLKEFEIQGLRTRLFMLWVAVSLVLLMCCLNLANLYLVRGISRRQEHAVRAALGAPGARLVRQQIVETLLLLSVGGGFGVWLASRGIVWARSGGLGDVPRIQELTLDGRALALAATISVVTAVAFGLLSTARTRGAHIIRTVRASGHGSRWTMSLLSGIQATQMGMTFVLLLGAWLLGETFTRLARVEPGYDPHDLLVVPVDPPSPTYDGEEAAVALYARLLDAIRGVHGVESVALANHGPGGLAGAPTPAAVGREPGQGEDDLSVYYRTISAGYFTTLRTPLVAGREFTEDDLAGGEGPLIVNESLAARLGGSENAVGRTLGVRKAASSRSDFGEPLLGSVVGVVADLDPSETGGSPVPMVYVPFTHTPWAQVRLLVRATAGSRSLVQDVENAVRSIEPGIPLTGPFVSIRGLEDIRASQRSRERLNAGLVGAFAALALLLACIGMYGVTSFGVTLRTREMGVRMALGAAPRRVAAGVVGRAAVVGIMGLLGGAAVAATLSSLIASLLFDVGPLDPDRYAVVAASMLALIAFAAYLPARRASELDPALVLRGE